MKPRVVYWNNIPSPYFVDRLNAVARRGNIDIEAWFSRRITSDGRTWDVDETGFGFPSAYVPSMPRLGRVPPVNLPVALLSRSRPDLFVSLYAEPGFVFGWWLAHTARLRIAFRMIPTFDAVVHRTRAKSWLKREMFGRVDGVKVPGPDGVAFAIRNGVPEDRIHIVRQSIDVDHFRAGRQKWRPERGRTRSELGLHGCVFVYVGRLVRDKGIDHLMDAYDLVARSGRDVSLLLVGVGDDDRLKAMVEDRRLPSVVFTGFVQQTGIPRLYAAGDVFVFPTLGDGNGLVVDEAMVSGLAVVSSSAAGDIRLRVPEGEAGYVVPPGDARAMADRMLRLAADPVLCARQGEGGMLLGAERSLERYASDFEAFVEAVLASPRLP